MSDAENGEQQGAGGRDSQKSGPSARPRQSGTTGRTGTSEGPAKAGQADEPGKGKGKDGAPRAPRPAPSGGRPVPTPADVFRRKRPPARPAEGAPGPEEDAG